MRFPLLPPRAKRAPEAPAGDGDRDLIALVNEARDDAQRERAVRAARARARALAARPPLTLSRGRAARRPGRR